ncbi:MAG: PDZ domain-containing protein [Bacteroidales bacterium]|nr:PDZ domain-containing protein [Bacteroidales bacterium]
MSRWNLAWLLGLPALFLFGLIVVAKAPPPSHDYDLVRSIVDVLAEVDQNYVRDLTPDEKKKLVEDMINGGLERLDPHSQYFNAEDFKQFEADTDGQFGGIGVLIQKDPKTGFLKVESPLPGTPAYEAGIQANDFIVKIGDKTTQNLRMDEARELIIGPSGTTVTISVFREGDDQPRELTLTRGTIEIHSVMGVNRQADNPSQWNFLYGKSSGIALIRLRAFNEHSYSELKAAVEAVEKAGAQALILDLRDNPGGLLTQAVQTADLFLNDGKIVSTGNKRHGGETEIRRSWSAKPGDTLFEPAARRPMAVLVNGNSASASEILASALQDNGRAVVIGERSYGKGSVQKVFALSDNKSALKLTTEVWLTPKGKNIHRWPDSTDSDEWGVRPDEGLEVKLTNKQRREYIDHMRELDRVQGKPGQKKPEPEKPNPKKSNPEKPEAQPTANPYVDPVVEKAAEYLRDRLKEVSARGHRVRIAA